MANRYGNLIGTNKIREEYQKINQGFDKVQEEQDAQNTKMQNHVSGTADKHKAEDVNYTGNVPNATNLKEGLDNLHDRVEQIITTPIEGVSAQEIIDARKGKTTLRAKMDDLDSQLAEIANNEFTKPYIRGQNALSNVVTFFLDDGYKKDMELALPVAISENIPISIACLVEPYSQSQFLSTTEILTLQNTYGWEICSHTYKHADLSALTVEQLEHELGDSKAYFENLGIHTKNVCYP